MARAAACWLALGALWVAACAPRRASRPARLAIAPAVRARCLDVLRQGMRSEDFWPSVHAAEALTVAGHGREVREFLGPKLRSERDDRKRCGLARELVRAGDRAQAAVLLEILAKPQPYGHVHAAESLYKVGQTGDGRLLRDALAQQDNPSLQLMAAAALGRHGSAEAMRLLRRKAADADPKTSRTASWVLARIGDASDIPQLRRNVARAPDPLTRAYSEHALAKLGDAHGRKALARNLRSADPAIRTYAAVFAGEARMLSAAGQLVTMLDDPVLDVRIRAAQSLLLLAR